MWGLDKLKVDSTSNLVSLRCDWHRLYENSTWAFVPTLDVLKKIEKAGNRGTYEMPYSGFFTSTTPYTFTHFPTFRRKFIHREVFDDGKVDTYQAHDDFVNFPILHHHAHPYLVIASALLKFGLHKTHFTEEQRKIYNCMLRIRCNWKKVEHLIRKRATKRKRDNSDCGSGDGDAHNKRARMSKSKLPTANSPSKPLPEKTRRRLQALGIDPGPEEPNSVGKHCLSPSPPALLQTIHANKSATPHYDLKGHVLAWVNNVTEPLAPAEDIILRDNETGRELYEGDWHDWCFPWIRPPKAMFSSNDQAIHHVMCSHTGEIWHSDVDLSSEGTSHGWVDWPTGVESTIESAASP